MENNKITIGFRFVDEFGNESKAESTFSPVDTQLTECFSEFRRFLQYVGFYGFENENLLEKSLTDDEYEYLLEVLEKYREEAE